MKLITAIIKPFRLEDVREALMQAGVQGMTVTEVRGFGRQQGQAEAYRGAEHNLNLVPKLQIEVVVDDDDMARVTDAIAHAARSVGTRASSRIRSPLPPRRAVWSWWGLVRLGWRPPALPPCAATM